MVSTRLSTSKSSSLFNNLLVIVPIAPITIGIIVTNIFHFFNSLTRSRYLSFFSISFSFILWSAWTAKSTILKILFFLLIIIRSGLLAEIRSSVCTSKFQRSLCVSFSRTAAGLCLYHLFVWSNLNFLHISQWITWPTQSCLVLYSYANLLANYYYYYYFTPLRAFLTSVSRWSSTGTWVTTILLESSGLFFVLWPILTVL